MQQDHTLALPNLTMATQSNRTSVALLMKTISELSSQVTHLTAKLAISQAEVPSYIQQGQQVYPCGLSLRLQHHPCRTSENNIRPGFNNSLPKTPQLTDQQRLKTAEQLETWSPILIRINTLFWQRRDS